MERVVKHQYETLNALRGVAAILVVLFHCSEFIGRLVPNGYLAVDLFFVLSGFVIAYSYDVRLAQQGGWVALVRARIIRFWPLVALAAVACVIKALGGDLVAPDGDNLPDKLAAIAGSLFLVPLPQGSEGYLYPTNVPLWTLGMELLISIAYALLFPRLAGGGLRLALLLSGICLIVSIAYFGNNDLGASVATVLGGVARAAFGFLLGVLLFRSKVKLSAGPVLPIALLIVFLCWPVPDGARVVFDVAFVFLVSPLIVLLGASSEPQGHQAHIAQYLGGISFSLYMLHGPVQGVFFALGRALDISAVSVALGSLLFLLLLCPLVDHWYDQPVRRFLRRRLEGVRPAPAAAA